MTVKETTKYRIFSLERSGKPTWYYIIFKKDSWSKGPYLSLVDLEVHNEKEMNDDVK